MHLIKRGKYYYVRYRDEDGFMVKKSTGKKTKGEAWKWVKDELDKEPVQNKSNGMTLKRFSDEYLKFIELTKSKNYLRSHRSTMKQLLEKFGSGTQLRKLSSAMMEQYLLDIYAESSHAAHHAFRNYRAAFNWAVRYEHITKSPIVKSFKLPKIPQKTPAYIRAGHFRLIIKHTTDPMFKSLYYIAIRTGMRLSEIVNMKWQDINFADRVIKVANNDTFSTKSGEERFIPMLEGIYRRLSRMHDENKRRRKPYEYVFHKTNGIPWSGSYVSHLFKQACKDAELPDEIHFHSLRHSLASHLALAGASLLHIMKIMGHEDFETTLQYAHLQSKDLSETMALLERK